MKLSPLALTRFVLVFAVMGVLTAPAWGTPVFTTNVGLNGYASTYFGVPLGYDPGFPSGDPQEPLVYASIFCPDSNAEVNHTFNPSTDTIDITVVGTGSEAGSFAFHGFFSGNPAEDDVTLTFLPATGRIGDLIYTIAPSVIDVAIGGGKETDITGDVQAPEPSYFGILAVGLVGLGFFRYRNSKTQAAANQTAL